MGDQFQASVIVPNIGPHVIVAAWNEGTDADKGKKMIILVHIYIVSSAYSGSTYLDQIRVHSLIHRQQFECSSLSSVSSNTRFKH